MICKVLFSARAKGQLESLDKEEGKKILGWLVANIQSCDDPHAQGSPVQSDLGDFWVYRVEKYKLICILTGDKLVLLSIDVERSGSKQ